MRDGVLGEKLHRARGALLCRVYGGWMSIGLFVHGLAQHTWNALLPRRRALDELRAQWGRSGDKFAPQAARWFEIDPGVAAPVDDKTWADLEFPRLFARLDTTVTPLGSQALYRLLHGPVDDPDELAARHALHQRLHDDVALREGLQRVLLRLQAPRHAHVVETLFGVTSVTPPARWRFVLWNVLSLLPLAGLLWWSWSAWWWIAALFVNLMLVFRFGWEQMRDMERVDSCMNLLGAADALTAVNEGATPLPPLARLRAERAARDAVRHSLWLLRAAKREPVAWVMPWLNLLCLLELSVHLWSVDRFLAQRERLRETFAQVAQLDAALALASALAMYPRHCVPVLAAALHLDIVDGRHPLLPEGVANSIDLDGQSLLVTGSNMAGKTTFVKMLAINAILGRTAGFCLATRAVLPCVPVYAAVQGEQSVASGKSLYFAQVEAIRAWLAAGARSLIVLDEPFSGTNTTERIAIANAVLRVLGKHSLVLVTTHDVELQSLLGERYGLCHFQENPDVEGFFDYRLHTGPATERNAIRLLARMGFPHEIVASALAGVASPSAA